MTPENARYPFAPAPRQRCKRRVHHRRRPCPVQPERGWVRCCLRVGRWQLVEDAL